MKRKLPEVFVKSSMNPSVVKLLDRYAKTMATRGNQMIAGKSTLAVEHRQDAIIAELRKLKFDLMKLQLAIYDLKLLEKYL